MPCTWDTERNCRIIRFFSSGRITRVGQDDPGPAPVRVARQDQSVSGTEAGQALLGVVVINPVAGLPQPAGHHQPDREEGDVLHRIIGVEDVNTVFACIVPNDCRGTIVASTAAT
jgi:hypothetical protein